MPAGLTIEFQAARTPTSLPGRVDNLADSDLDGHNLLVNACTPAKRQGEPILELNMVEGQGIGLRRKFLQFAIDELFGRNDREGWWKEDFRKAGLALRQGKDAELNIGRVRYALGLDKTELILKDRAHFTAEPVLLHDPTIRQGARVAVKMLPKLVKGSGKARRRRTCDVTSSR